jgi:GNAT superfamily N-acetyltransferase
MPESSKNPTFTILRAANAHVALARQAILEVHRRPQADETALLEFSDPARYLLLALEADRVVGSLSGFAVRHPHRCEPQFLLYEIDVRPECQNRGIGQALVERFIMEAKAAGAFEVWVLTNQSNQSAMAMYAHCGFQRQNQDDVMLSYSPFGPSQALP